MTRPTQYLTRMLAFLAAVIVLIGLLHQELLSAFAVNPMLNGLIVAVLLLGISWNIRQVSRLTREVGWLEAFQKSRASLAALPAPRLLAPMASMLAARAGKTKDGEHRLTLSAAATRALLDTIASRLDESRDLSRYATGLLIFLGLLGTFWGLLLTVHSVGNVINGMSVGSGDVNALFEQLKSGLAQPLKGMGTAFSSSMLGLASALVLGFLDLTAGQAQNRFFNELEEWLAGLTRLSSGVLGTEGDGTPVPVYVQALLEQTAENMEGLQHTLSRSDDERREMTQTLLILSERLAAFADTMRTNQQLMLRLAESQQSIGPAIARLSEARDGDEVARGHLRNIEIYLQRLLTETEQGRMQSTTELRNEIKVLTRTIAALAEDQQR
jgi:hypothetical protein